jgi:hypothetical protein
MQVRFLSPNWAELGAHLVMELLRHPLTGVDVHARGAVGALGDDGAAAALYTEDDVHARW